MSDRVPHNHHEEDPEHDYTGGSPFVMLLLIGLCVVVMMTFIQPVPSTTTKDTTAKSTATEIVDRAFADAGTHKLLSQTPSGTSTILTYEDTQGKSQTITVENANLTREIGQDGTVSLSVQRHDRVEIDSGKVVSESAKPDTYKATVYYDPDKREGTTYQLVSLEKNGESPAVLTYAEANGITDTIKISPKDIKIIDDGAGKVEKIKSYDEHGIWNTKWEIHSLP